MQEGWRKKDGRWKREWVIRWEGRRGREKFLDQINAFRGAGDRDHALSSSLPAAFLRLFEAQRRGERKSTHTSLLSQTQASKGAFPPEEIPFDLGNVEIRSLFSFEIFPTRREPVVFLSHRTNFYLCKNLFISFFDKIVDKRKIRGITNCSLREGEILNFYLSCDMKLTIFSDFSVICGKVCGEK